MKLLLSLLLLTFVTTSYADDDFTLVIKQKSGNETSIGLSTNPVITIEGTDLVVTNDLTHYYISLDDIDEYFVNPNTTDIKDIPIAPKISKGHVVFSGIPNNTPINVYSIDGKIVKTQIPNDLGNADVSISDLSKGVYIISANKNKIKVINNK